MRNSKIIHISAGTHKKCSIIWIKFNMDRAIINRLRTKFKDAKWSRSQKSWYVPDTPKNREILNLSQSTPLTPIRLLQNFSKLSIQNQAAYKQLIDQLQLKGYSINTIRTYASEFLQFIYLLKKYPAQDISENKIRNYLLYCIKELKLSESVLHSRMNALKFYYEQVLFRKKIFLNIPRPKKQSTLPKALNQKEITRLFNQVTNIKHLLMLKMCYGMGLRISEVVSLKINTIDTYSKQVFIAKAKGKKDRVVRLPNSVVPLLKEYYKNYKPKEYLFEGMYGGQYSTRSLQAVFRKAIKKANINKKVGIHSLRHSFAKHLLENGTDISHIQYLLGHNSINTTLIYTKISNKDTLKIISPLDRLYTSKF